MRRVEFRIRIGTVPISRSPRAEHHAATLDGALVHLSEVYRTEMDLEGTLVAERLQANVALYSLLTGGRIDEGRA